MKREAITKGMSVSYFNYMATSGGFAQCAFRFARVIGVGKVWVSCISESGNRIRLYPWDLHDAPEGEEYLKKAGI